jgi:hypothetical protein
MVRLAIGSVVLCAFALAGCRSSSPSSADAAPAPLPSASATASALPAPKATGPRGRAKALGIGATGSADLVVLLDDGGVLAVTREGGRHRLPPAPGRDQLRRGDGDVGFLERGRPFVWHPGDRAAPQPLCDLQQVRDIYVRARRACIVSMTGALACTEVSNPDCTDLTKRAASPGTVARLGLGVGGPVALDAVGAVSFIAFKNAEPHLEPLAGVPSASAFLGTITRFTSNGQGGFTGVRSEICLTTGDTNRCFDVKTGRARALPDVPTDATRARVLAQDAVCFVHDGSLKCHALDVGFAVGDPAFLGRILERTPLLPPEEERSSIADYDGFESLDTVGMTVLTTNGTVWRWQAGPGARSSAWQRVDLDAP